MLCSVYGGAQIFYLVQVVPGRQIFSLRLWVILLTSLIQNNAAHCRQRSQRPSIKYVTLFWTNFDPPPLSHISGPPKVRHTSRTPHVQQQAYMPQASILVTTPRFCAWGREGSQGGRKILLYLIMQARFYGFSVSMRDVTLRPHTMQGPSRKYVTLQRVIRV